MSFPWKVELPNTDALRILPSLHQCYDFLQKEYNIPHTELNVDIEQCYVSVPAFAESRKAAISAKAKDCAAWGAN